MKQMSNKKDQKKKKRQKEKKKKKRNVAWGGLNYTKGAFLVQIFYDDFFISFLPNMGRKHYGKLEEKILVKSIFSLFF